jgi:galactokinase
MKTDHLNTLGDLMEEAITAAQQQKRRVRGRLADMRGEFGSTPVRGPWKPGRPGVKWHLYQAARRKHHALTEHVRALQQLTRTA